MRETPRGVQKKRQEIKSKGKRKTTQAPCGTCTKIRPGRPRTRTLRQRQALHIPVVSRWFSCLLACTGWRRCRCVDPLRYTSHCWGEIFAHFIHKFLVTLLVIIHSNLEHTHTHTQWKCIRIFQHNLWKCAAIVSATHHCSLFKMVQVFMQLVHDWLQLFESLPEKNGKKRQCEEDFINQHTNHVNFTNTNVMMLPWQYAILRGEWAYKTLSSI